MIYEKIKKKRESYYWGRTAIMWGVGFMVYISLALIVNSQETALPTPLFANTTDNHTFCEERYTRHSCKIQTLMLSRIEHINTYNILEKKLVRDRLDLVRMAAQQITFMALLHECQSGSVYVQLIMMISDVIWRVLKGTEYPTVSVHKHSSPGNTKYLNMLLNDTNGSNNKEMTPDTDDDIWQNIYFDGIGKSEETAPSIDMTRVTENIAVIVEGENGLNHSLLVVSHFDSSTLSPGTWLVAIGALV